MNIGLIPSGTRELFWSLLAAALEMDEQVFSLELSGSPAEALPNVVRDLRSRPLDIVVGSHFLVRRAAPELLFLLMNLDCPVVSIALGHPLIEVQEYVQRFGMAAVQEHFRSTGLLQWIGCPHAAREYALAGFGNGFYMPHPSESRIGVPERTRRRWLGSKDVPRRALSEQLRAGVGGPYDRSGQLLYLGTLAPRPKAADGARGRELERLAQSAVEMCTAHPERPRLEHPGVPEVFAAVRDAASLDEALLFHDLFAYHSSERVRLRLVSRLKREYGARFVLYGNDWIARGLDAHPTSPNGRGVMYQTAALSLDFGSLSFETCVFPRTIEVVKSGGLLLSARRPDSAAVFGALEPAVTFASEDTLLERVGALLDAPDERERLRAGIRECIVGFADNASLLARLKAIASGDGLQPLAAHSGLV